MDYTNWFQVTYRSQCKSKNTAKVKMRRSKRLARLNKRRSKRLAAKAKSKRKEASL